MIRNANSRDYPAVVQLLTNENLPVSDIPANLDHFLVEELEGEIIGCIGMEVYHKHALLRSLAVSAHHRNKGIASRLITQLKQNALELDIRKFYLVTTTAEEYFRKCGFLNIDRKNITSPVIQSAEFNGLCPATAVVMFKNI